MGIRRWRSSREMLWRKVMTKNPSQSPMKRTRDRSTLRRTLDGWLESSFASSCKSDVLDMTIAKITMPTRICSKVYWISSFKFTEIVHSVYILSLGHCRAVDTLGVNTGRFQCLFETSSRSVKLDITPPIDQDTACRYFRLMALAGALFRERCLALVGSSCQWYLLHTPVK